MSVEVWIVSQCPSCLLVFCEDDGWMGGCGSLVWGLCLPACSLVWTVAGVFVVCVCGVEEDVLCCLRCGRKQTSCDQLCF